MGKRMTPYHAALGYATADVLRAMLKDSNHIDPEHLSVVVKAARTLLRVHRTEYMQKGKIFAAEWNKLEEHDHTDLTKT